MNKDKIAAVIIGGQGTYKDSLFFTEFPDRELSIEYMMGVVEIAQRFKYTHLIPSGGFTQSETSDASSQDTLVSEASSFENVWKDFGISPGTLHVVKDEVALDSAENIICGLMALRIYLNQNNRNNIAIGRIGFFSQWHFKKRRMTELAKQLGIEKSFYFHGYAHASEAAAGDAAKAGEQAQLDRMIAEDDFLLLGQNWEEKRQNRFKTGRTEKGEKGLDFDRKYSERWNVSGKDLKHVFQDVFKKLDALQVTTIEELDKAGRMEDDAYKTLSVLRKKKLKDLQDVFNKQVILGDVTIS